MLSLWKEKIMRGRHDKYEEERREVKGRCQYRHFQEKRRRRSEGRLNLFRRTQEKTHSIVVTTRRKEKRRRERERRRPLMKTHNSERRESDIVKSPNCPLVLWRVEWKVFLCLSLLLFFSSLHSLYPHDAFPLSLPSQLPQF